MARSVDISDEEVIRIARELFLEKGIAATEMKDIAQKANIGRSSLYRHFESKESLAFYTAAQILTEFNQALEGPAPNADTGARELLYILERYVQALIENPAWVRFLDEFDQLFSDAYPASKAAEDYIAFNKQLSNHHHVEAALARGVRDGSLRLACPHRFAAQFLLNTLLGLAQRVVPRAEHFQQEQEYSLEYLTQCPKILVDSFSAK